MVPAKTEISPIELARSLEEFLSENPRAVLLGEGQVLFDMAASRYSLSTEHGRCVLHVWSEEHNVVRTVVGLESRKETLRVLVRRLGTQRPQLLELAPDSDRRRPATRASARKTYLHLLKRVLARSFHDCRIEGLRAAMDLENSFGPAYARGLLVNGQRSWAVIGVCAEEMQATIDAMLTVGILWLAHCRKHSPRKRVCQGLKVFVPADTGATTRARMAWLNRELAQWELYEVNETSEELSPIDIAAEGNLKMRLVHAFNPQAALERAQSGVDQIMRLVPEGMRSRAAIRAKSANEVALSLHGLEFARVRQGFASNSFALRGETTFGAGLNETPLQAETEAGFSDLMKRLFESRRPGGSARNPLFRLQPEGWLESTLLEDLGEIEPSLRGSMIYSQVPAFAGGDRAMLDLLTVTRDGRLAVLELKADEDLQLPLQGVDYWIRVHRLQEQRSAENDTGELERSGYFPGITLERRPPLLYYVVPALRVHPTMETVLEHLSPVIAWTLIALNERWREERKVVFRKRRGGA